MIPNLSKKKKKKCIKNNSVVLDLKKAYTWDREVIN